MKNKLKQFFRSTFISVMFLIGSNFPSSGIIKECESDYDDHDDIQMFI